MVTVILQRMVWMMPNTTDMEVDILVEVEDTLATVVVIQAVEDAAATAAVDQATMAVAGAAPPQLRPSSKPLKWSHRTDMYTRLVWDYVLRMFWLWCDWLLSKSLNKINQIMIMLDEELEKCTQNNHPAAWVAEWIVNCLSFVICTSELMINACTITWTMSTALPRTRLRSVK